jgi:histidinol-phosphate aminotransferase
VSTLSAALALAGLEAGPPDVSATIAERERLAAGLRSLGLEPLPSWTNFLLVRHERAAELGDGLLRRGLAVRASPGAIRITVHRPEADDRLLAALRELV